MEKVLSIVYNEFINDNRVLNQAISLDNSGYDVTILALKLRTAVPSEEKISGIKVLRIFRGYGNEKIFRIKFIRLVYKILKFNYELYSFVIKNDFSVIHCHDLNTLQLGFVAKLVRGNRFKLIYDAHEYETQRNLLFGFKKLRMKIKERFLIKFCDKVITVSDSIADEYVRLYGITKPTVILNCPVIDPSEEPVKSNVFRKKFNIPFSNKIFLYQGYLVVGRGIEIILEAFKELDNDKLSLVFMGEGSLLETIKNDENYNKSVFIHPFVKSNEIIEHTSSADFGISFIEDISLSDRYCLPNKLFEYIAAGLPVITSGLPEMKKFVETYEVGVSANENSVDGFLAAFKKLLRLDTDELDSNISDTRRLYHWGTQEKVLLNLYESLNIKQI